MRVVAAHFALLAAVWPEPKDRVRPLSSLSQVPLARAPHLRHHEAYT